MWRKVSKIPEKSKNTDFRTFSGIFSVFLDFFGYFLRLFSRPPKRPFLRLFCDFGPGGPGNSCKWRVGSQTYYPLESARRREIVSCCHGLVPPSPPSTKEQDVFHQLVTEGGNAMDTALKRYRANKELKKSKRRSISGDESGICIKKRRGVCFLPRPYCFCSIVIAGHSSRTPPNPKELKVTQKVTFGVSPKVTGK